MSLLFRLVRFIEMSACYDVRDGYTSDEATVLSCSVHCCTVVRLSDRQTASKKVAHRVCRAVVRTRDCAPGGYQAARLSVLGCPLAKSLSVYRLLFRKLSKGYQEGVQLFWKEKGIC